MTSESSAPMVLCQLLAEIAREMLEHVGVIPPRRCVAHYLAESVEILDSELLCGDRPGRLTNQITQASHSSLFMRHQQELMTRVELHDSGAGQSLPLKIHPAFVAEHLRHEVLAKPRVIQPPPLLPWADLENDPQVLTRKARVTRDSEGQIRRVHWSTVSVSLRSVPLHS